jgi:hypothetical protein
MVAEGVAVIIAAPHSGHMITYLVISASLSVDMMLLLFSKNESNIHTMDKSQMYSIG